MKIQFASDLHLEMQGNSRWIKHNPLEVTGDVLVLAGDIIYLGNENLLRHPFWKWASENYKQVLVVPGNHEFYDGFDIGQLHDGWTLEILPNVRYYYNSVVWIENVEFILSTLWAEIKLKNAFVCEQGINDFFRIIANGKRLDYTRFNEEHKKCVDFISKVCSSPLPDGYRRIIVSHHLPSFQLMDQQYKDSPLNGAFVSEQSDVVDASGADYWIFGHSHSNTSTQIGRCKCVSNQRGYVAYGEGLSFDVGMTIICDGISTSSRR